ncbi:flagellar motor component [Oleiphilus messinensis]|uniref:Flagellar motor component n=1 Tax=Oleiphilus messinensis TaxID=141451 RepID=A0A1Y0I1K8_9GAMM|nr:MotA/TolQ/ExbB proton channel family protein [Oleiphilus messinensis]ARU54150.1 flagellar motor component [Oleiphilus messinensis]
MDIATLIGLFAGIAIVLLAIVSGSEIWDFINGPGLAIVVFGTMAVTLIKFRLSTVWVSLRLALKTVFVDRLESPILLIQHLSDLGKVVRKDGILGLERVEVDHPFLKKSIDLCVDGHPPEFVEEIMMLEIEQSMERYDTAERIFRGIGDTAPALGMLGTLVGLVQMLNNMEDPSSIGPAMAIALLTTFYGAFIAQLVALPLAEKMRLKALDEHRNMSLIATSMQSIIKGQNPRVIGDILSTYLPPVLRDQLNAAQAREEM